MRKKTFKIFVNSFIISLFTMWAFNELFAVPAQSKSAEISIPEKNIALFFQSDMTAAGQALAPVEVFSLAAPLPRKNERDILIDKNLFVFDSDEGISISSVEDAADIPLEYSAAARTVTSAKNEPEILPSDDSENNIAAIEQQTPAFVRTADIPVTEKPVKDTENLLASVSPKTEPQLQEENVLLLQTADSVPSEAPTALAAAETDKNDHMIPLEFGLQKGRETSVEIATAAPDNQIAMAEGGTLDVESIAVKPTLEKGRISGREWHEMTARDVEESPWVVAKGTRNPKNNHVLEEDFYKGLNESEIVDILNRPEAMADEDNQVQTAEMVKNILIPIPEDILNDKNLTPQLVSPKKSLDRKNPQPEEETVAEEEKSGGLFKSLASMFSSSDSRESDDVTSDEEATEKPKKTKKRKGLFSAFGSDKTPTKILPAEMRLSFQPGRAEISGTTLRWIQAFANKVIEDPNVILEVRIDRTSSFELQQKRLNLLHNILTNKGVDYEKINTVFTSREPNSFIIRTLRINENVNNDMPENNKRQSLYYQSW